MKISSDLIHLDACWLRDCLAQHGYRARGQAQARGWLPKESKMCNSKARECTPNARVYFAGGSARRPNAAIEANFRGLGYGE